MNALAVVGSLASNSRLYACGSCVRTFSQRVGCTSHIRPHEKDYVCNITSWNAGR